MATLVNRDEPERNSIRESLGLEPIEPVYDEPKKSDIELPNISNTLGRVLAFDQSLSSTGWCLLSPNQNGGAHIWKTGVIKSTHDLRGHEATLQRFSELVVDLEDLRDDLGHTFDLIIHETPPVGGKMARPESSLLAAAAIRTVFQFSGKMVMIGKQKAAKRWTGNGNAKKIDVRNALMGFGYTPKEWGLAWNEHIADSLALGLYGMENS